MVTKAVNKVSLVGGNAVHLDWLTRNEIL